MPPMSADPQATQSQSSLSSPAVLEYLDAVRGGRDLTFDQALTLATSEGADFGSLLSCADALRRETVGEAITYVVNRNINSTNVCFVGCSFCGFGKGPGPSAASSLSPADVVRKAREA